MAQEPLKPAYVIWGEDRATIDRALVRLAARVEREGGMAPERMRAEDVPPEDVLAACEALSFAGLRLVIVEGADAWKADATAALVAYLAAPNPGTCLALVSAGQLTPKLHGAIAGLGGELRFGPDPKAKGRERVAWLVEHFRSEVGRAGGSVTPAVARAVVDRVMVDRPDARRGGITTMELAREAEKLAAYADGEPIVMEMVDALVSPHPDAKAYELADAIVAADAARAYDLLQDLATGEDPTAPIVVQVQLTNRFRSLAMAQALGPDPKAKGRERVAWLVEHFRSEVGRAGGSVTPAVARAVVDRVMVDRPDARRGGITTMELAREAEKLAAYADGEPIVMEMVDALVSPHPDAKAYELADAIVAADAARAYDLLQDLATGEDPTAPIVVQVQLTNRFRSLALAQALGPDPSPDEVGEATGVKGYPARILAEQARALPAGTAQRAVARLAALELDLRVSELARLGRSRDDGERLVLEVATRDLMGLVRGGRPAPADRET